jgi:hypothetical protein
VNVDAYTTAPDPDRERQAEWRQTSVQKIQEDRQRRAERLRSEAGAIRRATQQYLLIDRGLVEHVALAEGFVRVPDDVAQQRRADRTGEVLIGDDIDQVGAGAGEPGDSSAEGRELIAEQDAHDAETRSARQLLTRPPLTRLINRSSHAAVSVLLTAIYLAHVEGEPGSAYVNRHRNHLGAGLEASWVTLCGLFGAPGKRARRARLTRALTRLNEHGFVQLGAAPQPFEGWSLLAESGSGRAYQVPGSGRSDVLRLPSTFFSRGWHLVLEPREIATLLALRDLTRRLRYKDQAAVEREGVALPESVREDRYGISGEVYESVHELEEFGLLTIYDPMPNRRRGKVRKATAQQQADSLDSESSLAPLPYRFKLTPESIFEQNALDVVQKRLSDNALPPRLQDYYEWGMTQGLTFELPY